MTGRRSRLRAHSLSGIQIAFCDQNPNLSLYESLYPLKTSIRIAGLLYYTTSFTIDAPRVNKVRNLFAQLPPAKVLDVGCGNGIILRPLDKRHEIYGVDISEIAVAQANAAGFKASQHDLEDPLLYENAMFDVVFCGETIEHQVDTDFLLSEINRVLKPGGQLVLTYPNIRTLLGIFMLAFLDMPPMFAALYRAPHYRDFTLRTIKIALRNNGFQLGKAIGCCFYLPRVG